MPLIYRAPLQEGYRVFESETLQRGLMDAATRRPNLIVLDLGLPDGDGQNFILDVRGWSNVPIIVLSARTDEEQKVNALDAGANDYLVKPFGISELVARVRVALRASPQENAEKTTIHFSNVSVDLVNRQVFKDREAVHLTPIEFRLLTELLANVGKVLTQRQLLSRVWGPNSVEHGHYLRIYMGHLRQKLEQDPARPKHFLTEIGVGYRFML